MSYIYKITNDINNKIYVGKTNGSIKRRFQEHCRDAFRRTEENRPLYAAMRKYGIEHFHIEQIEETDEPEVREKFWIEKLKSFKYGYNATLGGDGRPYLDYDLIYKTYLIEKTIAGTAKITGYDKSSVSSVLKNIYKISSETILQNTKEQVGSCVGMFDKDTKELLKTFSSTHEAGKFLGKSHQHIQEVCKNKRKSAYGYFWKYL